LLKIATWRWRRLLRGSLAAGGIALVLIQFVPYGHSHTNPPVTREPIWNNPQTGELAARACFDCHSNQTEWRWYTNVAPFSWYIQHDVEDGRRRLNFSEWDKPQREARGAPNEVQRGEMPPAAYLPVHPEARLSDQERQILVDGLRATAANDPPPPPPARSGGQRGG
jgi:hypothetical protein